MSIYVVTAKSLDSVALGPDRRAASVPARGRASQGLLALVPVLASLALPATAWGDIYKWTDEQGRVNISNIPPPAIGKSKVVEIVLKEDRPVATPQHLATPTEQALLGRIESLERQLQSRQTSTQTPAAPQPAPYASYYPPGPPPPPPSASAYSSGYVGSYASYYPSYQYPVARSYVVYPATRFVRVPVVVAPRGGAVIGGGGHSGGHRGRR
jgi:hypothetical protein